MPNTVTADTPQKAKHVCTDLDHKSAAIVPLHAIRSCACDVWSHFVELIASATDHRSTQTIG